MNKKSVTAIATELVPYLAVTKHSFIAFCKSRRAVEIVLKDDHVVEMYCDCPYAADGNNCKHMAAVLFAVEDEENCDYPITDDFSQPENDSEDSVLAKNVAALSDAQLRQLLIDTAKKHGDVRDRIAIIG